MLALHTGADLEVVRRFALLHGKLPWMSLMSTPLGSQVAEMDAAKRLQWAGLETWAGKTRGIFRESQS